MLGRRPYNGKSRSQIRDQILAKQAVIKPENCPQGWSLEAVDFVNQLIQRKCYKRLGKQGISELKQHSWFINFDWKSLKEKKMKPPFVPNVKNVFEYLRNLTEDFTEMESSLDNSMLVKSDTFQNMFLEYDVLPHIEIPNNKAIKKKKKLQNDVSKSTKEEESKKGTLGVSCKDKKSVKKLKSFSKKSIIFSAKDKQLEERKQSSKKINHHNLSLASKKRGKSFYDDKIDGNRSLNPPIINNQYNTASINKIKNGLKSKLKINSKKFLNQSSKSIFPETNKKEESQIKTNMNKNLKHQYILKNNYYLSPNISRKKLNNTMLMNSINYSKLRTLKLNKNKSFSKNNFNQSIEKLNRKSILDQDYQKRLSMNNSFFNKIKKIGKKNILQEKNNNSLNTKSQNKLNSFYLTRKKLSQEKTEKESILEHFTKVNNKMVSPHQSFTLQKNNFKDIWYSKRNNAPLGINLSLVNKKEELMTSFTNKYNYLRMSNEERIKNNLELKKIQSNKSIYKQLENFEQKKNRKTSSQKRKSTSRNKKKSSQWSKLHNLTFKLPHKENNLDFKKKSNSQAKKSLESRELFHHSIFKNN